MGRNLTGNFFFLTNTKTEPLKPDSHAVEHVGPVAAPCISYVGNDTELAVFVRIKHGYPPATPFDGSGDDSRADYIGSLPREFLFRYGYYVIWQHELFETIESPETKIFEDTPEVMFENLVKYYESISTI